MFRVFHIDLCRARDFNDFTIQLEISPYNEDIVCSLWGRNLILNIFYFRNILQRVSPCHKIFKYDFVQHLHCFLISSTITISTYTFCIKVIFLSVICKLSLSYHWPITEHLMTLLCRIYSVIFSACTLPKSVKFPCKHYAKYFCNSTQILVYNVSFILHKYRCI
jgi:hypothetical protein